MIYLHKFLPFFLSPVFFIIFFIFLGFIFNLRRFNVVVLFILISSSLPIVSDRLISFLENDYELLSVNDLENGDAIVVLSGMLRPVPSKDGLKYEWTEASDRFFAGVNLFKARKAPILIFTRGKLPWTVGEGEGEYLRSVAKSLGIDEKRILLTKNVQNTEEEARAVGKLLSGKGKKIILVSSAFHLNRASRAFKEIGFTVDTFPVDFRRSSNVKTALDFIPNAESLRETSFAIRELSGRLYYSLKYNL